LKTLEKNSLRGKKFLEDRLLIFRTMIRIKISYWKNEIKKIAFEDCDFFVKKRRLKNFILKKMWNLSLCLTFTLSGEAVSVVGAGSVVGTFFVHHPPQAKIIFNQALDTHLRRILRAKADFFSWRFPEFKNWNAILETSLSVSFSLISR